MRLPDGRDCPYYYVNAHRRARAQERCNLLDSTADAAQRSLKLCESCPVPRIRRANGCPFMTLQARVSRVFSGFRFQLRVRVRATCTRSGKRVANPYTRCGQCHTPVDFAVSEESRRDGR